MAGMTLTGSGSCAAVAHGRGRISDAADMNLEAEAPLAGVRVLEIAEGIAAPFAARLLRDLGADVVKIERPGNGDRLRTSLPYPGASQEEVDTLFSYVNAGKKSVQLDLSTPQSELTLKALVDHTDIVISGLRPGRLERWGAGASTMRSWNPALVVTGVSNFGQTGPYSNYEASDMVLQAMSGLMQISGSSDNQPLKRGLRQSLYAGGMNAAYVSIAGFLASRRTGRGSFIDVSLHECLASEGVLTQGVHTFLGAVQGRRPPVKDPLDGNALHARDGFVTVQTTSLIPMSRLATFFEEPRLVADRFATKEGRATHAQELTEILEENLAHVPARQFFERASREGILAGFVQNAKSLLACDHLAARNSFGAFGPRRWSLSRGLMPQASPGSVQPAPAPGDHTADALAGDRPRSSRRPARSGAMSGMQPLEGLKVIDFSLVFAMPYLTALLSDLGADVIKIEAPQRLDQTRIGWGGSFHNEPGEDPWNRSAVFHVLQRGKRSVAVDMSTSGGRDVVKDLVAGADVVVEAFSPPVMARWGLDFAELIKIRPGLIMVSNSGYGATGPWSTFKAQGTTLESTMGVSHFSGYSGGPPMKVGQSYPDFLACWTGLIRLMAALVRGHETGDGRHIDLGMYELGAAVMPEALIKYQASGRELDRTNGDIDAFFSAVLQDAEDDRWMVVSVPDRASFQRLRRVVPTLAGFASSLPDALSESEREDVSRLIADWLSTTGRISATRILQDARIAAGPVLDIAELTSDQHLIHRGFLESVCVPAFDGDPSVIGRPYVWSSDDPGPRVLGPAPSFGAHTRDVLLGAGYDAPQIETLLASGAVAESPKDPPSVGPLDIEAMLATGEFRSVERANRVEPVP